MQPTQSFLKGSFLFWNDLYFFLQLKFEGSGKSIPHFFFSCLADMGVNVAGGFDITMSEPFLNILQLPSGIIKNTGCAMTDIMKSHVGQPFLHKNLLETSCNVIGTVQMSIGPHKDIIVHVILRTEQRPVALSAAEALL